jgi:YtkA-like
MHQTLRALLFLALLTPACGPEKARPPAPKDAGGRDPAGAVTSGALHFSLRTSPDPMRVGQNEVVVTVTDVQGARQDGCNVVVTPWMPGHGHGSTEKAVVAPLGEGGYRAFPVTLQMAGQWELRVEATCRALVGTHVAPFLVP